MPTQAVNIQGITSRKKPQKGIDTSERAFRSTMYGEEWNQQVHQKAHALADEGSYFVVSNPTPNTGVAGNASSAAAPQIGSGDTKPWLTMRNGASAGDTGAPRTYLDYIRFRCTAIGTAGTSVNFCIITDVANAARNASGGTSLTPINCNMDDSTASVATNMNMGAVTVSSTSTGRLFPNLQFRSTIGVVGDLWTVSFGPTEYPVSSLITTSASTQSQGSFGHPPLVIGPGQWVLIYLWQPSQSAASSFECDMGWWER